ncbi:RelA/SpoT family protein [Gammaproteobacteria bacterium]|nr:RelA/SpoT family protein [Gammaproteobacteria bacterium]
MRDDECDIVVPLFEQLCRTVADYLEPSAFEALRVAADFSAWKHREHRRKTGEAYITHPLTVGNYLAEMRVDLETLIAALLHDVQEDSGVSKQEIHDRFGARVAHLVDGVSKIEKIEARSATEREARTLRKMVLATSRDYAVVVIKLADRLHNMRTLGSLGDDKQRRIALQTRDIFAPIAMRFGLYDWGREMEDIAFSILHPKRYKAINDTVRKRYDTRRKKRQLDRLVEDLLKTLDECGVSARVYSRRKHAWGIYQKMVDKTRRLNDLQDIHGIRVVVGSTDDCYRALGIVHAAYKPVPERFKDYIALPKANGYQSLHTVVHSELNDRIEVQIRSEEMQSVAEYGVAAHWRYKDENRTQSLPTSLIAGYFDESGEDSDASEFLDQLKADLRTQEVYVFTPKHEIRTLPAGATAIDFAYSVHTDIGNHCISARVNGSTASIFSPLSNGDQVEIVTGLRATPKESWLDYIVTGRARVAIRAFLREQSSGAARRMGSRLLRRQMIADGHRWMRINRARRQKVVEVLKVDNWDLLLEEIGKGSRSSRQVVDIVVGDTPPSETPDAAVPMPIKGAEGYHQQICQECGPVLGDRIIGQLIPDSGLAVHRLDCRRLRVVDDKRDLHPLSWNESARSDYLVNLYLDVMNRPRVLARVATAVADEQANISYVQVTEPDVHHNTIHLRAQIANRKQLADIIRRLRAINEVLTVRRHAVREIDSEL